MAISRFRHTQSTAARPDRHFLNVTPSGALWDCSNMMACNDRFVAVPWSQLGSTAVMLHTDYGKVSPNPPILLGQSGPIIDLAFHPFDSLKLFTASEDGTIMGWNIPAEGLTQNCSDNMVHLQGHNKKVGILSFHPSADNVLASAGMDMAVNVWDVEAGKAGEVLKCHSDQIMSLDWNLNGSLLCSTSRDKKVNIMDPRKGVIVLSGNAHQGGKTQRCLWAKRSNFIITAGFSKTLNRQVMLWDTRNMDAPVKTEELDQTSSVMMPFFDEDTNILYIGSRGEGGIRSYELMDGTLVNCAAYASTEAHKGLCMFPKWSLDARQCEIARFYALTPKVMYTIQMLLPRRQADSELQADVYPPTFANKSAITAKEYFSGECSEPLVMDMHAVFDGTKLKAEVAQPNLLIQKASPERTQHTPATHTPIKKTAPVSPTPHHVDPVDMTNTPAKENNSKEKRNLTALLAEVAHHQAHLQRHCEAMQKEERCIADILAKINAAVESISN